MPDHLHVLLMVGDGMTCHRPIPQSAVRQRTLQPLGRPRLEIGTDCASAAYDDVMGGAGVALHNPHDNSIPMRSSMKALLLLAVAAMAAPAQTPEVFPEVSIATPKARPVVGRLLAPFHLEKRTVPPAKLANTPRLEQLVRSGNLYLTAEDVIALALENNLDIAVERYGPYLSREGLRRAEAGGLLRGTDVPVADGPTSVSTAGISTASSGLAGGAGIGSGGGIVTGIGPNPPNMDPSLFGQFAMGHSTTPLTNTQLNATTTLVNSYRQFYFGYSQSWITGTYAQATFGETRSLLNSSTPLFNPSLSGALDVYLTQPLLQGLSIGVNNRYIKVAKKTLRVSDLLVKQQVATTDRSLTF